MLLTAPAGQQQFVKGKRKSRNSGVTWFAPALSALASQMKIRHITPAPGFAHTLYFFKKKKKNPKNKQTTPNKKPQTHRAKQSLLFLQKTHLKTYQRT